jgi:hypothetical protein
MVIRAFHPLDVARHALRGPPATSNRAYTLSDLSRNAQPRLSVVGTARSSLSLQGKRVCAFTWAADKQIKGIVAARPRLRPEAWEVTHLLALDEDPGQADLLRRLCKEVARRGGEKIFLRLRSDDPLVEVAQHTGFMRYGSEVLFRGAPRPMPDRDGVKLRNKRPSDEFGLFQLYNAATPVRTRYAMGVTFGQWSRSRERSRGRCRELVYERDGVVRGWLSIAGGANGGRLQVMVHPDEETNIGAVIDSGLAQVKRARTLYCPVPEHQVLLQRLLAQRGFEEICEFAGLVRSMVVPVGDERSSRAISVSS